MSNKQTTTKNQQALAFGLGLMFFVCVLIGLFSAGWWLKKMLVEQEHVPVNSIVITGEMPYTQRADVLNAISNIDLGNFFQVNVNDIQQKVSQLPWVYSVAVRKQWPNEVKIYVVDQRSNAIVSGMTVGIQINSTTAVTATGHSTLDLNDWESVLISPVDTPKITPKLLPYS